MNSPDSSFARLEQILPFFHISVAILFVALQLTIVAFTMLFLAKEDENKGFFEFVITKFKLFFALKFILIFAICISGIILASADDFKTQDPMLKAIIATKWALSVFITLNIFYMIYKFNLAIKALRNSDFISVRENFVLIAYYFTPLNIVLSFVGTYLGIAFRGF